MLNKIIVPLKPNKLTFFGISSLDIRDRLGLVQLSPLEEVIAIEFNGVLLADEDVHRFLEGQTVLVESAGELFYEGSVGRVGDEE